LKTFLSPLTPEQENECLKKLKKGSLEARNELTLHNMRLVAHVAKKYSGERDNEDLISIGIIGLIKAINSFDINKGNRLGTYAAKCIENEMLMMFRNEKKRSRDVSLNEPIGTDKEGNTICLIDVVESDNEDVISNMERQENVEMIRDIVENKLTKREREIIERRYGMNGRESETQKIIGKDLNISRSYVSRIEKRALEKIKSTIDYSYKM
jgi:RNA polymerase sporulation-specific sigma factor